MCLNLKESYYTMYVILDHIWPNIQNKDDIGFFLGVISPVLWRECEPIDPAIYNDWCNIIEDNIEDASLLTAIIHFLGWYQQQYGFSFAYTIAELERVSTKLDLAVLIAMGKKLVMQSTGEKPES